MDVIYSIGDDSALSDPYEDTRDAKTVCSKTWPKERRDVYVSDNNSGSPTNAEQRKTRSVIFTSSPEEDEVVSEHVPNNSLAAEKPSEQRDYRQHREIGDHNTEPKNQNTQKLKIHKMVEVGSVPSTIIQSEPLSLISCVHEAWKRRKKKKKKTFSMEQEADHCDQIPELKKDVNCKTRETGIREEPTRSQWNKKKRKPDSVNEGKCWKKIERTNQCMPRKRKVLSSETKTKRKKIISQRKVSWSRRKIKTFKEESDC